jgi:hypothetical protein
VRSGGIAGLRSEHDLDTERLPEDQRHRVAELLQGVSFFAMPSERRTQLPDMIQYRMRVEDQGHAHEVCFDDACEDTALLELVERVTELARTGG